MRWTVRLSSTLLVALIGWVLAEARSPGGAAALDPAIAPLSGGNGADVVWIDLHGGPDDGDVEIAGGDAGAALSEADRATASDNPFANRGVTTAAEAFAILMEDEGLNEVLSFAELEETGREGFVLRQAAVRNPASDEPPVPIGAIRVDRVDVAGLVATGMPDRFAIALEAIDYAALAAAGPLAAWPALPHLADAAALSFSLSLLPTAGASDRRELGLVVRLEGQLAMRLAGRMLWPAGPTIADDQQRGHFEAIAVELVNNGFLGALVAARAAEIGIAPADLVAALQDELAEALEPAPRGSLRARVLKVAFEALESLDVSGVLRLALTTTEPRSMQDLLDALGTGEPDADALRVELTFQPTR